VTRYRTIVADPPWPYAQGNVRGSRQKTLTDRLSKGVSSVERYGSMSIAALCAITPPAETDAHLWLWTTNAFMAEAHDLAQAWGFAPKTIGTWGKVQPNGEPSRKVGYYLRGATEHCILAVRGSLAFKTSRAYATRGASVNQPANPWMRGRRGKDRPWGAWHLVTTRKATALRPLPRHHAIPPRTLQERTRPAMQTLHRRRVLRTRTHQILNCIRMARARP
jgi:hypothetical protein